MAKTFARLVGLASLLYGGTVFFGGIVGVADDAATDTPWLLVALACVSLTGIAGSVLFLLGLDGPQRFRTRRRRVLGWGGMMLCALMPTSLLYLIAPLVLAGALTLFIEPGTAAPRGRHRSVRSA
jgi:hypothetical protein